VGSALTSYYTWGKQIESMNFYMFGNRNRKIT